MRVVAGSPLRVLVGLVMPAVAVFAATATAGSVTPAVTITSGPAQETSETNATFEFAADGMGSIEPVFKCSLDGAEAETCTSPQAYQGLSLGAHAFTVTLANAPASEPPLDGWTWIVVAPDCPVGMVGTPPDCKAPPLKPGRLGKLTVKHPKKLKSGKRLVVRAGLTFRGETAIKEVKVCLSLPRRVVSPANRQVPVVPLRVADLVPVPSLPVARQNSVSGPAR